MRDVATIRAEVRTDSERERVASEIVEKDDFFRFLYRAKPLQTHRGFQHLLFIEAASQRKNMIYSFGVLKYNLQSTIRNRYYSSITAHHHTHRYFPLAPPRIVQGDSGSKRGEGTGVRGKNLKSGFAIAVLLSLSARQTPTSIWLFPLQLSSLPNITCRPAASEIVKTQRDYRLQVSSSSGTVAVTRTYDDGGRLSMPQAPRSLLLPKPLATATPAENGTLRRFFEC